MIPRRGAIAFCGSGLLGIITSSEPQEVAYADGNRALAWTGIHLTDDSAHGHQIGSSWSSRKPKVIGYIVETEEAFKQLRYVKDAEEIVNKIFGS